MPKTEQICLSRYVAKQVPIWCSLSMTGLLLKIVNFVALHTQRQWTNNMIKANNNCEGRSATAGGAFGNSQNPEKDPWDLRLREVARLEALPAQRKMLSFFCMLSYNKIVITKTYKVHTHQRRSRHCNDEIEGRKKNKKQQEMKYRDWLGEKIFLVDIIF